MRETGIGNSRPIERQLREIRQPGEVLHPFIGDGRTGQVQLRQPAHAPDVLESAVVEEPVVTEIEVLQLRERRERIAREARLMQPHFLETGEYGQLVENRIFQRNVGLDRLAQDELLEIGGRGEQSDGVGDERHRLVVPKPAVDVELFEVR